MLGLRGLFGEFGLFGVTGLGGVAAVGAVLAVAGVLAVKSFGVIGLAAVTVVGSPDGSVGNAAGAAVTVWEMLTPEPAMSSDCRSAAALTAAIGAITRAAAVPPTAIQADFLIM